RTSTNIDENPVGCQDLAASLHLARRNESRMVFIDPAVLQIFERSLDPAIGKLDDMILACFDALHIDLDVAGAEAVVGAAAREVGGVGARDQGFRRCAARVDTSA